MHILEGLNETIYVKHFPYDKYWKCGTIRIIQLKYPLSSSYPNSRRKV